MVDREATNRNDAGCLRSFGRWARLRVDPRNQPHCLRQRRPKGRGAYSSTDCCSRPAPPAGPGGMVGPPSRVSCNPNSFSTKAGVRGHRKTRQRTLRVGNPASTQLVDNQSRPGVRKTRQRHGMGAPRVGSVSEHVCMYVRVRPGGGGGGGDRTAPKAQRTGPSLTV